MAAVNVTAKFPCAWTRPLEGLLALSQLRMHSALPLYQGRTINSSKKDINSESSPFHTFHIKTLYKECTLMWREGDMRQGCSGT